MTRVRVLVANRPRLMRELVLATICDQPDIEVLGEIKDDSELAAVVAESQPDFLIIALGATEKRPEICDVLLRRDPNLRILALAPELNRGMFFWAVVEIHSRGMESSEAGILSALRGFEQLAEPAQGSGLV